MTRIGFLINPIAGMGGRVGLKGTDGVVSEARALGAQPVAAGKAAIALQRLHRLLDQTQPPVAIEWLSCTGAMGVDSLEQAGFSAIETVYRAPATSSGDDTIAAVQRFLQHGAALVLFCGGDGTARDVCSVTGQQIPVLGIPSGVKMYSGVFAVNPLRAGEIVYEFLHGRLSATRVDILDLDEDSYRRGEWRVRLFASALTPFEPTRTQAAKVLISETSDDVVKAAIADSICEQIKAEPDVLYLLGPGSTVAGVAEHLGLSKTLLGIDALRRGELIGRDLNERRILDLLERYPDCRLVLGVIGAQGFVLGRGNQQLSPAVVRAIGRDHLIILATPAKLARTPLLHFDSGDAVLDAELSAPGFVPVVTGYRRRRMVKTAV
jgi:predicted polyphosphate/ATP-dependent NAD kinase